MAVNNTPLSHILSLFGDDTFLVPCEWGTKKPLVTYVERPPEKTKTPAYRALLGRDEVNIAVYLGKKSANLCAIDIDDDKHLEAFLAANPKLANTTRSRGSRGAMIWVRIQGDYPQSCTPQDKTFEWRADGRLSTIHGRHPKGANYTLLVDSPPVTIQFSDIVWPEGWELPWLDSHEAQLVKQYGEPFYLTDKGSLAAINEPYWAGLYAKENEVLFEKNEKEFYSYSEATGLYVPESEDSIRTKISSRMLEASRQMNLFDLQKRRNATTLKNVVTHLRGIVEEEKPFNRRSRTIHLANGVIVFDGVTPKLYPFSPEFKARNSSPISFDEKATCPRFLEELVWPAVHPEDADLLQVFAGMFLLGYNRAQRFLVLDGEAGRGKTQFAVAMQGLVGNHNVGQLRTKLLEERFELHRYLNRTLLVGVDVTPDFLATRGAGVLKSLVGGDWFDTEGKHSNASFQVQGHFNVIITSNARLRVRLRGDLGAWRRRINIVRYEAPQPKKKIADFGDMLIRTEGPGILNWAIVGAQRLLTEMPDEGGDFHMTERQHQIVDSLLAESDSLRYYLQQSLAPDPSGDVTVQELIEGYAQFCPSMHWRPMPITEAYAQLEGLMLELYGVTKNHRISRNERTHRGFDRVRLKSPPNATEPDNAAEPY